MPTQDLQIEVWLARENINKWKLKLLRLGYDIPGELQTKIGIPKQAWKNTNVIIKLASTFFK